MTSRVNLIIEHERDADHLEAEAGKLSGSASEHRWEAARLIFEELADPDGLNQAQLARAIHRTPSHVMWANRSWKVRINHGICGPFDEVYHSQEVRSPQPQPGDTQPARPTKSTSPSTKERVRSAVQEHISKTGELPSSRSLMPQFGARDDRSIRAAWDKLHEDGELPERPKPRHAQPKGTRTGGPAGQILDEINERLKVLIGRIRSASDREREWGRDYWVTHLTETSGLVEQALEAATGADLDKFLSEVENERP